MATTYLTKQITSAGSRKKATISLWVKRGVSTFGNDQRFFSYENTSASTNVTVFKFSGDSIQFADQTGGSNNARYDGTRKLRDPNAWYHFLVKMDTTQSTNTDRLKVYINGELQSEGTYTYPSQNADLNIGHNSYAYIDIGRWRANNNQYFDGAISHFHYTDGYAYDASTFGSTDSTTGEWKINTTPSVTYGTNGFFLLKDNLGVTDQSGQSNNYTVGGGTLTALQDNPSNNFCTWNGLDLGDLTNISTLSSVNTYYASVQGGYGMMVGTIGVNSGKWYWEAKYIAHNMHGFSNNFGINPGFCGDPIPIGTNTSYLGKTANSYAFQGAGSVYNNDSTTTYDSGATAASNLNDVVGIALDLDNNKAYYHVNGTYWNSANPSSGTGGLSINAASSTETGFYFPAISDLSSNRSYTYAFNFGNGYFGSSAISSEGTNASNLGKFEYDVPTGFTAICTKGLNE